MEALPELASRPPGKAAFWDFIGAPSSPKVIAFEGEFALTEGQGDWLADRLVEIGDTVKDEVPVRIDVRHDPFLDDRLRVANLPREPQKLSVTNPISGKQKEVGIALFRKPGEATGARRAISEIIKWMNYVTDNRFFTIAADLSESINVEHGSLWGHYDPVTNPLGTRIKAAIQEAGNVSSAI